MSNIPHYLAGIKKVIFNQNSYYTFGLDGSVNPDVISLYNHEDVLGVVTVSKDNQNFLVDGLCLDPNRVFSIINGIDSSLFYPPAVKTRRIVYLQRKSSHHAILSN